MMRIPRFLADRRIVWIAQLAVGVLFLASGLSKIGEAAEFARQIRHYHMAAFGLENLVAITLPWIELVAALAILTRVEPRGGSAVGAGLLALFVAVVAVALVRHLDIQCGCFGTADATRVGTAKLFENIGTLVLALVACQRAAPRAEA
jgi:uncharacterized membrane protein YphA (DoxX/SURF4 family)